MAPRSGQRPPRSKNALVIAASAITRSVESSTPSRLSTLRLIADALNLFSNSKPTAPPPAPSATPLHTTHDPGSRALVNAAVAVLLTLPSTGGTLHRRALALLHAAAPFAGSATLLSASERARSHLKSLRPASIPEGDLVAEAAFTAAAHTVAYTSRCDWAGRAAAESSTRTLLAVRGSRAVRAAAAHAAGRILESFPVNFAPDADIINSAVEVVNSVCITISKASSKSTPKPGFALLAAAIAPRLASRPLVAEKLLRACVRALADAPEPEKGTWAVAAARLAIVSRAARGKRPSKGNLVGNKKQMSPSARSGPPVAEAQIFEGALISVARIARLTRAGAGCVLALTAVLRAWATAIPEKASVIPARAIALLAAEATSIASASILRDSIVVGVVRDLEPSASYPALERVKGLFGTLGRVGDALVVDLCAVIVRRFGAQAVLESSGDYEGLVQEGLLEVAYAALDINFSAVRLAGVRFIAAIVAAVPQRRVGILAAILQGLRIADLALVDGASNAEDADEEDPSPSSMRGASRPNSVPSHLSAVLGNAVALAVIVEEATERGGGKKAIAVPQLVLQQCMVSALKLLSPFRPTSKMARHHLLVTTAVRRRAAWAIVAALARGHALKDAAQGGLSCLFPHWNDDLSRGMRTTKSGSGKSGMQTPSAVADTVLAETAKRCAALTALTACLAHEMTPELRKFSQIIVGGCAARVALDRNSSPNSATRTPLSQSTNTTGDSMFYRASQNPVEPPAPSADPDEEHPVPTHSFLYLAESLQIARCTVLAPPTGVLGDLCYYVAVALGEDAQKALGVAAGVPATGGVVAQFMSSFTRPAMDGATLAHRRLSLSIIRPHVGSVDKTGTQKCATDIFDQRANDYGWMCNTEGLEYPIAEETLAISAEAISSLVIESISSSSPGSVLESFCSSAMFNPAFSACLALSVARRISSADLAQNGRVLATMQVLVGRSLKASVIAQGLQNNPKNELRNSSSEGSWMGTCIIDADLPGSVFRAIAGLGIGEPDQKLLFPVQCPLRSIVFHGPLTRTLGVVFGTRTVTAEAYRVLASRGGPAMWLGLMKSVTSALTEALGETSASAMNMAVSCTTVLGVLLESVPGSQSLSNPDQFSNASLIPFNPGAMRDETEFVVKAAVSAIAKALDSGDYQIQAAAAITLSNNSLAIVSESERLLAALSLAWSMDNGVDSSPAQAFKCAEDAISWDAYLGRICNRIVQVEAENEGTSMPFLCSEAAGSACLSPALGIGVASVLASSRKNSKQFSESAAVAGAELCIELLHWTGVPCLTAQAAGFQGLTEMWAARINSGRLQGTSQLYSAPQKDSMSIRLGLKTRPASHIPIQFFSLRQAPQAGSSAGLYLEDVLYSALGSGVHGMNSGLQAAALRAIDLLLKESGCEAVSTSFKRLPEILFGALLDGLLDCGPYLEILANFDAVKRPRYWIGLSRAVSLGGKRLNTGTTNAVWDVNLKARQVALRIMRIAVTSSITKCECAVTEKSKEDGGDTEVEHKCALGCLKETLSAFLSALRMSVVDVTTVDEVCGALKVISVVFQDQERLQKVGSGAIVALQELWAPIAKSLGHFLSRKKSHAVVRIAAETACQWLLIYEAVSTTAVEEEGINLTRSLFGEEGLGQTARRFEHLEDWELEAADTVLSVLTSVSQLVARRWMNGVGLDTDWLGQYILSQLPTLKKLVLGACVDYTAMRSLVGKESIGQNGTVLSFGGVTGDVIEACYSRHMGWIVAAANVLAEVDIRDSAERVLWSDERAPGAVMVARCDSARYGPQEEVEAVCFSQLVLYMDNNETVRHARFDPLRTFMQVALRCAKSVAHKGKIDGAVPDLSPVLLDKENSLEELPLAENPVCFEAVPGAEHLVAAKSQFLDSDFESNRTKSDDNGLSAPLGSLATSIVSSIEESVSRINQSASPSH